MEEPANKIIFDRIYHPHANQLLVHQDRHRYRVIDAGRRWGKTALGLNEALAWTLNPNRPRQLAWIILPEYKQAKNIYWIDPDIIKYFMPYVQAGIFKKNDSDLSLYCQRTGSWLFLKGADNPDSLRGSGLDLIVWDEVADVKPQAFQVMSPTLADSPNHRVIYIGTPDGYNHLHDFALMGDHRGIIEKAGKTITPDSDWITFKFTSYENLAWPEGSPEREAFVRYLDKERQKYREIGQEDWFEQEYMGEFRKRAGAVHKLFNRETHLIADMQLPLEWRRLRGWDWGSAHPTASMRIAMDTDGNWFVEVCYKEKDRTLSQHSTDIKSQDQVFLDAAGNDPIAGYADPSGKQWITEMNQLGFSIKPARKSENTEKKSWTELAIDKINEKIAPRPGHTVYLPNGTKLENAPSFFILNREENMPLVDEFESLTYKKTAEGLQRSEIDDTTDRVGHYDLHAALRYLAVSESYTVTWSSVQAPKAPTINDVGMVAVTPEVLKDEEKRKQAELEADRLIMANDPRRRTW